MPDGVGSKVEGRRNPTLFFVTKSRLTARDHHDILWGMVRIPIFIDQVGNEIIIPGLWYNTEDPCGDPIGCTTEAMMHSLALNLKTEWREYEAQGESIPLPFYEIEATHSAFLHGGATVFLIGGPEFEAHSANQN